MSLYPGSPHRNGVKLVLDDQALQDSMAGAIEDAMADVYTKVKGTGLPDVGEEDRRILFTAVARGVLRYSEDHETQLLSDVTITHTSGAGVGHAVSNLNLNIQMDR